MSPTNDDHGCVEVDLASLLSTLVRPRKLGRVLAGDVGIYTRRDPDRVRGADVAFISSERFSRRSRGLAFLDVAPELVVEVLSPEDRAMDVRQKLREYFAVDVQLVWLVDPEARVVSVYRSLSDVHEIKEGDRPTGGDVLPGFEVAIAEIFEE